MLQELKDNDTEREETKQVKSMLKLFQLEEMVGKGGEGLLFPMQCVRFDMNDMLLHMNWGSRYICCTRSRASSTKKETF
ncbi:uncharacterized protein EAF01_011088 [Botrytis porri]|uniref:Uncharacterized protein n=1 Tax=Botrytis porri TaxID=87229 RepID=A0A4Z1KPK2_9HELO|nr:uncharacterized protein EAF01_011088 [Botrytis porri]KAF7887934.1 hypothetical protein EAF01_011088 [Botrytis porri]TGO85654.1 hypothetical protein BPOR_0375g00030 [Botrytis porri]